MSVWIARLPPAIESPRSSLRPGISSRFFSLVSTTSSDDLLHPLAREYVAMQPRDGVACGASGGRSWPGSGAFPRSPRAPRPASRRPTPASSRSSRACSRRRRTSPLPGGSERRKASESRRDPRGRLDELIEPTLPEARDLHAAAAHVEQDPVLHGQPAHRSQEAEAGLLLAGEDAHLQAQLLAETGDEGGTVLRVAHGGGGHRGIFCAPAPSAMARKSAMASKARAMASSLRRCVASSSRTSRSEARLPARSCRWPPAW